MPPHAPPKNGATSFGSSPNGSDTRRSLRLIHALIDQARRWTNHTLASSKLDPAYVVEKALAAIAFTLRFVVRDGTPPYDEAAPYHNDQHVPAPELHGTIVLSIPTKLVGVAAVQLHVRALRDRATTGTRFALRLMPTGVVVYWQGLAIGRIQEKHAPWLAPLLPERASVHLIAVSSFDCTGGRSTRRGPSRRNRFSKYGRIALRLEQPRKRRCNRFVVPINVKAPAK